MNDYKNTRQCILALSWRDIKFPTMGGAEIYTHEMLKRAVAAGIEIVHFAPACNGLLNEEYIEILGNKVQLNTIPVRPGRNVAIICESAAIANRQKKMGKNTAQEFADRIGK